MSEQHDTPEVNDVHGDGTAVASATLHVDRYESVWMRISVAVLVIFFIAITISAFSVGFQVPGVYQRIDPATLASPDSPFANPGLRELSPGHYEAYIRAQIWQFAPNEIRVPAGSRITFYVTSQDVQHGIKLMGTNINMMVLPGQISTLTATFNKPGSYHFVCHEYCGTLHHTMYGTLIVEAPAEEVPAEQASAPQAFVSLLSRLVQ